MARKTKTDNGFPLLKARLRQRIAADLPEGARVLEAFAGEGKMYRIAWRGVVGATMDMDEGKADAAANERRTWAVYHGDTEKALSWGWMRHIPFDVLDIDAYGEPWKFFLAWLRSEREMAVITNVVLTDGYLSRASISRPVISLFGKGAKRHTLTREDYLEIVHDKLAVWSEESGLLLGNFRTWFGGRGRMAAHCLTVSKPGIPHA